MDTVSQRCFLAQTICHRSHTQQPKEAILGGGGGGGAGNVRQLFQTSLPPSSADSQTAAAGLQPAGLRCSRGAAQHQRQPAAEPQLNRLRLKNLVNQMSVVINRLVKAGNQLSLFAELMESMKRNTIVEFKFKAFIIV